MKKTKQSKSIDVIATDSFDWRIKNDFKVHKMKNEEAIQKFQPDLVVRNNKQQNKA